MTGISCRSTTGLFPSQQTITTSTPRKIFNAIQAITPVGSHKPPTPSEGDSSQASAWGAHRARSKTDSASSAGNEQTEAFTHPTAHPLMARRPLSVATTPRRAWQSQWHPSRNILQRRGFSRVIPNQPRAAPQLPQLDFGFHRIGGVGILLTRRIQVIFSFDHRRPFQLLD